MENFRKVLHDVSLKDLDFMGFKYTWSNGKSNKNSIQERLNIFFANQA